MKMTEMRLISLSRHQDEKIYFYGLNTREPKEGDYIYCRDYGRFMCIQYVGKGMLGGKHDNWQVIEMSNNPELKMPQFPKAIVDEYFNNGKQLKTITIRL